MSSLVLLPLCRLLVLLELLLPDADVLRVGPPVIAGCADVTAGSVSFLSPGGLGSRRRSHGCLSALLGVIRYSGSHTRQRLRKSRNSTSSQPLRARSRSCEPGGPRSFPRLDRPPLSTVVPSGIAVAVQYFG